MTINAANEKKVLKITDLLKILPHRYPFLLVDKILDYDLDKGWVVGQKNLTFNESFFQGHFPGGPIMPGVLIIEALAQTGAVLVHLKKPSKQLAVLMSVKNAKFRKPVVPGDVLILKGEGLHLSSKAGKILAVATVNDQIAAQAEIGFAFIDKDQI